MALLPVENALAQLLADCNAVSEIEIVPLIRSRGRVLAQDQHSLVDVPPADNSAMDGYALQYADYLSSATLPVSQRIPAGSVPNLLHAGTAARIFTGASIPPGADTVVLQEDCQVSADAVVISGEQFQGQHIRPRGQDLSRGALVAARGDYLQGPQLGLLAAAGIAEVPVYRKLRVSLLSTGDELREPGETLAPGQIYNSNRPMLHALLEEIGCNVVDIGIVGDTASGTAAALLAAAEADIIISSGGVSVGEEDHVRAQVEALGELRLWKIAMKPGKPLAFGRIKQTPFLGLPGNPASSFVGFELFARPYLYKHQGRSAVQRLRLQLPAQFEVTETSNRQQYLRARVVETAAGLAVTLYPNQSSGVLSAVGWANALVEVPPGVMIGFGDVVTVLPLHPWWV